MVHYQAFRGKDIVTAEIDQFWTGIVIHKISSVKMLSDGSDPGLQLRRIGAD